MGDEEGHWTDLGLSGDVVVVAPIALACATLDIPAATDAPTPGVAAPLGIPHVWLDAAEFDNTSRPGENAETAETFWVVQQNGALKVINLGKGRDGGGLRWLAEEGHQTVWGDRRADERGLVLSAVRDVSRSAALVYWKEA